MPEGALTVSKLNAYVAAVLSRDPYLKNLRVKGEISGFKRHTSGHLYFTVKDEAASVRCVMFRQAAMELGFDPKDGMQVVITGYATIYTRD
ncbi:MAG: exodeoxyribonuclease VII large subunit, partial [Eubacteriales bacterium]|nr:exodeoxyribonuclease VII large subunit [Eubacteriales bacterium]